MPHPFHCICVDPQGDTLYIGTAQTLQAVDLKSGSVVKRIDLDSAARTEKTQTKPQDEIRAEIQTLAMARDGKTLIATTNEDKSAIVFSPRLESEISRHKFPKRPSAVDVTYDNSTLILADKFGDVYAVPMDQSTDLTVKDTSRPILGHVSMLVDLVVAREGNSQFIITADRDEHIRVSRYPQSYVIERWLFAHKEFVSKLCLIPCAPYLLLSGGGDEFLCLWNWSTGELLEKISLTPMVHETPTPTPGPGDMSPKPTEGSDSVEIVLSNIIPVPGVNQILVFCEGTSRILHFAKNEEPSNLLAFLGCTILPHTALNIAVDNKKLYVSYHHPTDLIGIFDLSDGNIPAKPVDSDLCQQISTSAGIDDEDGRPVTLYTIRTLRKRQNKHDNE